MTPNLIATLVAALIPMVIGFIWYNPNVFGKAWMEVANMTEDKIKSGNMPVIFGVSFVLAFLLALAMNPVVIHQFGFFSTLFGEAGLEDPNSELGKYAADFMERFGDNGRTFGHGALHGAITGIFLALPILATNAMFERKGFKYIAVNGGYWILTLTLMGGLICAWQ